jgi:hypothetical protein
MPTLDDKGAPAGNCAMTRRKCSIQPNPSHKLRPNYEVCFEGPKECHTLSTDAYHSLGPGRKEQSSCR